MRRSESERCKNCSSMSPFIDFKDYEDGYEESGVYDGLCRRSAPVHTDNDERAKWPRVWSYDWCEEGFKAKRQSPN